MSACFTVDDRSFHRCTAVEAGVRKQVDQASSFVPTSDRDRTRFRPTSSCRGPGYECEVLWLHSFPIDAWWCRPLMGIKPSVCWYRNKCTHDSGGQLCQCRQVFCTCTATETRAGCWCDYGSYKGSWDGRIHERIRRLISVNMNTSRTKTQ